MTTAIERAEAPRRGSDTGGRWTIFSRLTPKQHEVLALIAENRTSKEIAWQLGISESAVNQRIEAVRSRAGAPPRAELARNYRRWKEGLEGRQSTPGQPAETCNAITGENTQVPAQAGIAENPARDEAADASQSLALADSIPFTVQAPWQGFDAGPRIVPEALDGANAGLNRVAAMVAIAGGLLALAMIGLGVAQALSAVL